MKNLDTRYTTKSALYLLHSLLITALLFPLASCSWIKGPDYERPDVPMKKEWTETAPGEISAKDVIRPDWWTGFEDPYMNKLIETAVTANYNLKILSARLVKAGINVGVAKTELLPTITGEASSRIVDLNAQFDDDNISPENRNPDSGTAIFNRGTTSNFGVKLNWELDIWGKIKQGVEASKASYKATEAVWRGGYLTLVSDVATLYFQIRQFDQQISTQQRSLEQNIVITTIFRDQLEEGLVSETKVTKQEAEINRTRKDLLDLQRQRKVTENRLSTLLGIPAGDFKVPVASLAETTKVPVVPAGLPSDLLSRRPDLIAAEYQILRTHYLVQQSKLDLLPKITMTADGGMVNKVISGALKSYTFGLGPTISFPIFDPAKFKNLDSTAADQQTAMATYRERVIQAFLEVENSLVNLHSRKLQQVELQSQVDKLIAVKNTVIDRLKEGLVSQLDVLEAERSLVDSELSLLTNHQQILTDTVTLYKAFGGGWPTQIVSSEKEIKINENNQ